MPPGAAGAGDRDLLVDWHAAFGTRDPAAAEDPASAWSDDRLSHGGLMLWEADGEAGRDGGLQPQVAGVGRVGDVYTPPERRQRGYGGAITAAVSQQALDAGAAEVVLYTDLANPTSNALYQRLGYQPVGDRVAARPAVRVAAAMSPAAPPARLTGHENRDSRRHRHTRPPHHRRARPSAAMRSGY